MSETHKKAPVDVPCSGHVEDLLEVEMESDGMSVEAQKWDESQFAMLNRADLDAQIKELDVLAKTESTHRSLWDKIYLYQFPIKIPPARMVQMVGIFAGFAGILSGVDQAVISGAKPSMQSYFTLTKHTPLTASQISLLDSLMPIGAIGGSLFMTPINHFIGRRGALVISCIWYTIGAILMASAQNISTVYAGRFFVGCGVGIEGGCVGMYVSESVPANVRGNLVSLYHFMLSLGMVIGYAVGGIFFDVYSKQHGGWRFILGTSLLFSTIMLVGLFFIPESPRWLVSHGKPGKGWQVWQKLRMRDDMASQIEFLELRFSIQREREVAIHEKWYERYFEVILIPRNRRALTYGLLMTFLVPMVGMNSVLYNMSSLMTSVGFDTKMSVIMSIPAGAALFFGTIPAVLYMDKYGRRPLAQTLIGVFFGAVLIGVGSLYRADVPSERTKALGLSLTGVFLYMGFYGVFACFAWVIPPESFPLRTRAQGVSICSAMNYVWMFIITYNYEAMKAKMSFIGLMIGFYGGIAVVGIILQLLIMPETKDRTLEELDDIFSMSTGILMSKNITRMRVRLSTWGTKSLDDFEPPSGQLHLRKKQEGANKV